MTLHHLLGRAAVLTLLLPLASIAQIQEEDPFDDIDDIDAILQESDDLFESLTTPVPEPKKESALVFLASLRSGIGHSTNFLKRNQPIDSDYLQVEMDAFLAWASDTAFLSALLFAETIQYDYDLEPSDESMASLRLTGQISRGAFDLGTELTTTWGSIIYDSSFTDISLPSGTRIEQFVPSVLLYADWYVTDFDRLRFGLSVLRAEYDVEDQDFWNYAAQIEWEHVWSTALRTTSKGELLRQVHDDDVARYPNGEEMPEMHPLIIHQLGLEQELVWEPERWDWLRTDLEIGVKWRDEEEGHFEAMRQIWIGAKFQITNRYGQFRFSGRWGEYRYDERVVLTDTLNLQTLRSMTIEYRRELPWNLEFILRTQWNTHHYRLDENIIPDAQEDDSYAERRGELLIGWSY
jgi:hypothetical protein